MDMSRYCTSIGWWVSGDHHSGTGSMIVNQIGPNYYGRLCVFVFSNTKASDVFLNETQVKPPSQEVKHQVNVNQISFLTSRYQPDIQVRYSLLINQFHQQVSSKPVRRLDCLGTGGAAMIPGMPGSMRVPSPERPEGRLEARVLRVWRGHEQTSQEGRLMMVDTSWL